MRVWLYRCRACGGPTLSPANTGRIRCERPVPYRGTLRGCGGPAERDGSIYSCGAWEVVGGDPERPSIIRDRHAHRCGTCRLCRMADGRQA